MRNNNHETSRSRHAAGINRTAQTNGRTQHDRTSVSASNDKRPALITGGAGFIATNLAKRLLSEKHPVILFDNLSRPGVERNIRWIKDTYGSLARLEVGDISDAKAVQKAVKECSQVFHFAAQVAVTTSLTNPIQDFEVNARGTLNLLEAIRATNQPPPLVFTSTNKVYGKLDDVKLRLANQRYEPEQEYLRQNGFSESRPLDFHSPYGCSKGAAEQYVLDYGRTFGLPTVVFRMSCIYGPHQFGNEDQGWVAHFLIRALQGLPITLYGDGRQVRDILFVEDLVDAFLTARNKVESLSGQAFNIGGGPANTTSLLELIDLIADVSGKRPTVRFDAWRPADQQYYVSDTRKFASQTGWIPKVGVREGVARLHQWLIESGAAALLPISDLATAAEPKNGHGKNRLRIKRRPKNVVKMRPEANGKNLWKPGDTRRHTQTKVIEFP